MEESNCSGSLPSLLCNESEGYFCLDDTKEEEEERFYCIDDYTGLPETDEEEYIEMLVTRERTYNSGSNGYPSDDCLTENWLKCAYWDAVQWILKVGLNFFFF